MGNILECVLVFRCSQMLFSLIFKYILFTEFLEKAVVFNCCSCEFESKRLIGKHLYMLHFAKEELSGPVIQL